MLEIKSELVSEEEEEENDPASGDLQQQQPQHEEQQPQRQNVTYIIAHGPNGILTIPTYSR
jgi:hypothetical protein